MWVYLSVVLLKWKYFGSDWFMAPSREEGWKTELPYVCVRFLLSLDVVNKATLKRMLSALLLSIPYMSVFVGFLVCVSVFTQVYFSVGCCALYSISLWQHGCRWTQPHMDTVRADDQFVIRKCKESISALVSYQTDRWLAGLHCSYCSLYSLSSTNNVWCRINDLTASWHSQTSVVLFTLCIYMSSCSSTSTDRSQNSSSTHNLI